MPKKCPALSVQMITAIMISLSATLGGNCLADAQESSPQIPTVVMHWAETNFKNPCMQPGNGVEVATNAGLSQAGFAYLMIGVGPGEQPIGGVALGIYYDPGERSGVDVFDWHPCARFSHNQAGWPASGTGNTIVWEPVPGRESLVPLGGTKFRGQIAGYFYCSAYSNDFLQVSDDPRTGKLSVFNADQSKASFGGLQIDDEGLGLLGSIAFSANGEIHGTNPLSLLSESRSTQAPGRRTTVPSLSIATSSTSSSVVQMTVEIRQSGYYRLMLLDVSGRSRGMLKDGHFSRGQHVYQVGEFPAISQLPSGVFFARIVGAGGSAHAKLVVVK